MSTRLEQHQVVSDSEGNSFALRPRPCPTCGVVARNVLGLRGGAHHRYRQGIESRIVRCHQCSLIFPDPFPHPMDPQRLYGDPDRYFGENVADRKVQAYRALLREMSVRLGLERFSLLDVGSGQGELVAAARIENISAVGLEPSQALVLRAREKLGVEIRPETIEDFVESRRDPFDVVALCGVLEHVHDPDSLIACASRLTRPGSVLYIDVPREPNLLTIVGNAWNSLKGNPAVYNLQPTWPPYHVFGFNPRALRLLLSKHGFVIDSISVRGLPQVPARDDWRDRARALVASQIHRLGNHTGLGANMFVWARRDRIGTSL